MTHTVETRLDIAKTGQPFETIRMGLLRIITGKTLLDIRKTCNMENGNDWEEGERIEQLYH